MSTVIKSVFIKSVVIKKADQSDILAFYGALPRPSIIAWVAFWKEVPACIAGIALEEFGNVAFCDVRQGTDAPLMTVWRTAKALLAAMRAPGMPTPLIAVLNKRKDRSGKFLNSLGFVLLGTKGDNLLYGFPP